MEFRILGPLEVLHGGQRVPVGGSRERMLLIRLLLSANRVVSLEALAEDLWHGAPPEGAAQALWVYASRLRKALRKHGADEVLVTHAPGYRLRVEDLDAARFDALVERGREQAAAGDHAGAGTTLRAALALWRGAALADVADAPFARADAVRLDETRLVALEERIEADLACGRHRELIPELDALTGAHPLRERLWALRMLALYRSGRQADALRVYQQLRALLGEELGLEPSAALRLLESAILCHEPELDLPAASPAAPGTSEAPAVAGVAAFLFTDLVGSTELLARLGEDAAEELRHTHFALLRRAVAEAGGQEVKSLGDGLMVAFASPMAALGCAVAMQRAIAEHNASRSEQGLQVRIGLHAGEPVRAEEDYFGAAVVIAKRLCDQAKGGQILASQLLTDLSGSRGGFQFRSLGRLALKGLPDPVPTVAVDWQAEGVAPIQAPGIQEPPPQIPLPGLLTGTGRVFVDREAELDRLRVAWKEALGGGRRVVLVGGEPGVGKTRLAAALAEEVHSQGAMVLAGRCDWDLGVPYQPFVEALRHFVDSTPDPYLPGRLGRFAGELARVIPELADQVPGLPPPLRSDPETERYRLFDAVAAWLGEASHQAPLLLVLDDLQWAAKPTLLLLGHVVRSPQSQRLLVLGTYRDTELAHDHPLVEVLADLRRQEGVERLSLTGLDSSGVAAFMEQAAGHDLDEDDLLLARAIHEETEGNPFFVREVLRHLTETGAIERRDGRWTTRLPLEELGIPEGVREVVGRRLSHLSREANHVLRVAAVVGAEFELPVLQATTQLPEADLFSALEEAADARLLVEVSAARYRFAHALVRDTLYGGLSAPRRVALHRRVAESVERVHAAALDDYLPALAHHWARAAAPAAETTKAVDYATRAGDRALAQLANDEAAAYYRDALELLGGVQGSGHEARRLELLISLGEAQRRAGDPAHRENLLAAGRLAAASGDADALGRAAVANNRGLHSVSGQVDAERVAVLEAALEAVGLGDSSQRARLLGVLAAELGFSSRHEHRERLSTDALNMARRLGDLAILGDVLARRWAVLSPSDPEERARELTELSTVAAELGDPTLAFWGRYWGWMTALVLADKEGFAAALDDAARLADEIGQPFYHWVVGFIRSTQGRIAGRLAEAEARAEETLELGNISGAPDAFQMYGANIFWIRYDQGRLDEVVDLLRRGVARPSHNPLTEAALAVALCELDCWDEARVVYKRLAASEFAVLPRNFLWFYGLTLSAEACAGLGDVDGAVTLRRLLSPYGNRVAQAGSGATGAIAHYLALLATALGHFDEAETHFAAAETTHARIGAPTWLARTRLEWARMLLARRGAGDADRARGLLGQVLTSAQELGLGNVERRAAALLGPVEQGMGE